MKVDINEIPEAGLILEKVYQPGSLDLDREDIKASEPLYVRAEVTKEEGGVSVKIKAKTKLILTCARCLKRFEYPLLRDCHFSYKSSDGSILDITEDLREEIILGYPLKPLCREDCKGLCPVCGGNLNESECGCDRSSQMRTGLIEGDNDGITKETSFKN